jgi:hypothetical protein
MKIFFRLFFVLFMLPTASTFAQSLGELYERQRFEISVAHQSIDVPRIYIIKPGHVFSEGEPFISNGVYFGYRYNKNKLWSLNVNYTNLLPGDWLSHLYHKNFKDDIHYADQLIENSFSTGPFGELQAGVNLWCRKYSAISAGLLAADYFIGADMFDYFGEHIALGAFVNGDKVITENLVLRGNMHYARSLQARSLGTLVIWKLTAEVVWKQGVYAGIDYRTIEPFRHSGGRRTAFKIGYRFKFKKIKEDDKPAGG